MRVCDNLDEFPLAARGVHLQHEWRMAAFYKSKYFDLFHVCASVWPRTREASVRELMATARGERHTRKIGHQLNERMHIFHFHFSCSRLTQLGQAGLRALFSPSPGKREICKNLRAHAGHTHTALCHFRSRFFFLQRKLSKQTADKLKCEIFGHWPCKQNCTQCCARS